MILFYFLTFMESIVFKFIIIINTKSLSKLVYFDLDANIYINRILYILTQVMTRALKIIETLKLSTMVWLFDQAIYSKAIEIKWKEQHKFKNVFVMMGMFHLLMMFMHVLSKRFSAAGIRDILVQSNTISEGSVDQALCGKMYNRSEVLQINVRSNHQKSIGGNENQH